MGDEGVTVSVSDETRLRGNIDCLRSCQTYVLTNLYEQAYLHAAVVNVDLDGAPSCDPPCGHNSSHPHVHDPSIVGCGHNRPSAAASLLLFFFRLLSCTHVEDHDCICLYHLSYGPLRVYHTCKHHDSVEAAVLLVACLAEGTECWPNDGRVHHMVALHEKSLMLERLYDSGRRCEADNLDLRNRVVDDEVATWKAERNRRALVKCFFPAFSYLHYVHKSLPTGFSLSNREHTFGRRRNP
jgi:hypothetical protein